MKKLIIAASAIALFATACEKEDTSLVAANDNGIAAKDSQPNDKAPYFRKFYFHPDTGEPLCINRLSTCIPEVVVNGLTPMEETGIMSVRNAVIGGVSETVRATFDTHSDILKNFMESSYIEGVIDGTMYTGFNNNSSETETYLHIYDATNNQLILTLPIEL